MIFVPNIKSPNFLVYIKLKEYLALSGYLCRVSYTRLLFFIFLNLLMALQFLSYPTIIVSFQLLFCSFNKPFFLRYIC